YGLTDIVLDGWVVGDTHTHVDVLFHRRVALRDIDQTHGDAVPTGRGAEQEERIDALVVGVGSVTFRADHAVGPEDDIIEFERSRRVAAQAETVPFRGLGLNLVIEGKPAGEIREVAGEIRAGRLQNIPVGESAGGGPGGLLAHAVAAVDLFGTGGDRVPEV